MTIKSTDVPGNPKAYRSGWDAISDWGDKKPETEPVNQPETKANEEQETKEGDDDE